MGCVAVGATIYFGSEESRRQSRSLASVPRPHEMGMTTVLWCYMRNAAFSPKDGRRYRVAPTSPAGEPPGGDDRGRHHQAEAPETAAPGFNALEFGKTDPRVYSELLSDHPIDMTRYQLANCYMGRIPLINSGGASSGDGDMGQAVRTRSSTSAPAAWGSSRAVRRSSAPGRRGWSC